MRDLQNSMADFATLHDTLIKLIAPPTNFSNEILSSSLFLFLSSLTASLFISAHLLPWRFIFLVLGYALTASGHPAIQAQMLHLKEKQKSESLSSAAPPTYLTLGPITLPTSVSALTSLLSSLASITLSSSPETREVEIFELQHRPLIPPGSSAAAAAAEWTPHVFTPSPYDPLSPARISGSRPQGCRFFEDVQPPQGWLWKTKKWELDLMAGEWVAERLVTGVEFEVPHTGASERDNNGENGNGQAGEGAGDQFGGWVWDLPPPPSSPSPFSASAIGPEPRTPMSPSSSSSRAGKKGGGSRQPQPLRDWEEATTTAATRARTGEWRRRRWVRVVQRVGSSETMSKRDSSEERRRRDGGKQKGQGHGKGKDGKGKS